MAEDPNSPLNQAIAGLGTTIQSITGKVEAGKNRVRQYKAQIIAKLGEVVLQLNALKDNNNLQALPQLRRQLQDSQTALQQKTEELDVAQGALTDSNNALQQLRQQIDQINRELQDKTAQLDQLTQSGQGQRDALANLEQEMNALTLQKAEAERLLAIAQQQTNSIVERIGQINATLGNQIQLIDTIAAELGDLDGANDDVALQFKAVGDNIMVIMNMLNNSAPPGPAPPGPPPPGPPPPAPGRVDALYNTFINMNQQKKDLFYRNLQSTPSRGSIRIIQENIRGAIDNRDEQAINIIKGELAKILANNNAALVRGGKSRKYKKQKTMKKRHRKTRKPSKKYKGGYVYSASKDLDKASSIISASSSSKSRSNKSKKSRSSK